MLLSFESSEIHSHNHYTIYLPMRDGKILLALMTVGLKHRPVRARKACDQFSCQVCASKPNLKTVSPNLTNPQTGAQKLWQW